MSLVLVFWILFTAGTGCSEHWANVDHAVDGDTVRLENGQLVRYLGIDAPEINHKTGRAEPFAKASWNFNGSCVNGKRVRLETGKTAKDRYGRLLACVFDIRGRMINRLIISHGLAYYYPLESPQHHSLANELLAAQRDAMVRRVGLWADRALYKGGPYIGNRRSMRFHTQDCRYGSSTSKRNRIQFRSRWDAYWAGFLPAGGCLASPIKKELKRR